MRTHKQDYYFDLIEQWQVSALNQKDFCEQQEVKISTFQYWIGKYRKANQSPSGGFIALTNCEPAHTEITYPNGVRIRVPAGDQAHIAQLIHLW